MMDNLAKYTNLEIFMEFICTYDDGIKRRVAEEIDFRDLSWLKKKLLKTICKIAIMGFILGELQYECFMYNQKEIRNAFLSNIFFLSIATCTFILLVYGSIKY